MKRKQQKAQPAPCRLCGELAQPTIHFDVDWWEMIKEAAERELTEVRAEITKADRHIRMLRTPPPPAPR